MQTIQNSRSSRLFLIELMIAVLFFSLGSAVCVQAFAKAHTASGEARDLAFASATVSGAANVVRYTDGGLTSFQTYYPGAFAAEDGYAVCYDSGFAPCGSGNAAYVLKVKTGGTGVSATASICMERVDGSVIYALDLRYPHGEEVRP